MDVSTEKIFCHYSACYQSIKLGGEKNKECNWLIFGKIDFVPFLSLTTIVTDELCNSAQRKISQNLV